MLTEAKIQIATSQKEYDANNCKDPLPRLVDDCIELDKNRTMIAEN